jgi:hypothetical protein
LISWFSSSSASPSVRVTVTSMAATWASIAMVRGDLGALLK